MVESKQKFIGQIMTSKSPVRSCEDVDDTALSYAEIKSLATGNVHIKEKMELDIQVSKLKLLKAEHTSQKYRLETDIARNYPAEITILKERIAGLTADKALAAAAFVKGGEEDRFAMEIGGRSYTDRREAGEALISACMGLMRADAEDRVGQFSGFSLTAYFDRLFTRFILNIRGQCSRRIELGNDALGNIQRISNALAKIPEELEKTQQKLENVQRQLAIAKEEVEKPFVKEAELQEKLERLAELNVLLNMDEKSPVEAAGLDEEDQENDDVPEKVMEEETSGVVQAEEPEDSWEEEEGYACETGKGYFAIQETEGGYDYTFYDQDYKALDGGVYGNPDVPIWEAAEDILADEGIPSEEMKKVGYDWLREKTERAGQAEIQKLPLISDNTEPEKALNGQSRAEIEETVLCYAQAQIEDAGLDGEVELLAARVYGSRTREGLYQEDSDIDVVISYTGNIREDSFFNILNEGGLKIAGFPVDMNPISMEKTGTLGQYLENAEKYLDSREAEMKNTRTAQESVGSMETRQEDGTGKRKSVLADLKGRQERIERRENTADNAKENQRKGQEL